MKAKEPIMTYKTMPSTSIMRGRLIEALANENDASFIQTMYVMMVQIKNDSHTEEPAKYSLSELKGILSHSDSDELSYDEMRMAYMKDKFSL